MLRKVKASRRLLTPVLMIPLMAISFLVVMQPRSSAQVKRCPGNLVTNGDFTNGLTGWSPAYGTPDLSSTGDLDPGAVGMWGNMNSSIGEGLQQTLSLTAGRIYSGSIHFKRANDPNKQPYATFRLRATTTSQGQWGLPGTIYLSPIITSTVWGTYNFSFMAPGSTTVLTLNVENNLSANDGAKTSYGQFDNICIREAAPSLPCCDCLGQVTTLDLSTGQSGPTDPIWTVNGGSVYTTSPHAAWTTSLTPPAKWIQPVASPTPADIPPGIYVYQVQFKIPECTIHSDVRLDIKWAADNSGKVFLDNNATPVASCTSQTCYQTGVAQGFGLPILGVGLHTLKFEVTNNEGPSGLIVDMKLTRHCARGNPGPTKDQTMEPRLNQ